MRPAAGRAASRERLARLALLVALGGGAGSPAAAQPETAPARAPNGERVLLVGNSLTAGNDLPLMVEALSREGGRVFVVEALARGGAALEDHWSLGARERLAAGGWSFVVLQQGPSSLQQSRADLREWTRRFDAAIRLAGARTALYMVWPESRRRSVFPQVSESYRLAAQDVDAILLPAGEAWLAAWRRDPSLQLYGPDGFHPTELGSYLAALTIYAGLAQLPPVGLPSRLALRDGHSVEIPPGEAALAQAAAHEALGCRAPVPPAPRSLAGAPVGGAQPRAQVVEALAHGHPLAPSLGVPLDDVVEGAVEGRHHQQRHRRRHQHAAHQGDRHGPLQLGAGADGQGRRQRPRDGGRGGHQDRAQA
jgi:lysophospholipase L1-like esterase